MVVCDYTDRQAILADHSFFFIVGREGPRDSVSPLLLNGTPQPAPLLLKLGTKYRLRFINIGTNDSDATISFLDKFGDEFAELALDLQLLCLPARLCGADLGGGFISSRSR